MNLVHNTGYPLAGGVLAGDSVVTVRFREIVQLKL
jgi:hypothetical protein